MRYGSSGYTSQVGLRLDLLWTNDDPSSNFAAQSVTIDLSGYTHYMVVPIFSKGNQNTSPAVISAVVDGEVLGLVVGSGTVNNVGSRTCYYDSSVPCITFAGANYGGGANNAYCIPMYIYGIRSAGGVTTAGMASGGGGGGVTSVNGMTGVVVLDAAGVGAVPSGEGVPSGGTTGQVLAKASGTDHDLVWTNAGGGAVDSVNGYTGTVVLVASDVGALPDTTPIPSASSATPQALGTATAGTSTDFSRADHVHDKPTYTASDVGAIPTPASPSVGDFLVYTSNGWDAVTMAEWQGGNY